MKAFVVFYLLQYFAQNSNGTWGVFNSSNANNNHTTIVLYLLSWLENEVKLLLSNYFN
jgi:hypothetical protein